ncbi:MAG: tetratricopeptide repeat protein [Vulcanimicrobiota bacterium]
MTGKLKLSLFLGLLLLTVSSGWAQEEEASTEPATASERRQQADAEMEKARELLNQGYFDSAVVKYQDAFKIAPDYPAPYEELGKLMMEKQNFAYAIQMYSTLAELRPREPGYRKVLFNLYDAYDAPNEALQAGEVLLDLGQADSDTIKRMAALYGQVQRPLDEARMMQRYAEETDADAEYWNEVATKYLEQAKPYEAEDAVQNAIEKDPENSKYKNTLGRVYMSQNKPDKAEQIFKELSDASPEDQGLKDELAQIYAQQGDSYLINGRANTALKYYDLAEETGAVGESTDPATVGLYRGTVNTPGQVFNSANTPGIGVGSYRIGASGFTPLGGTLAERRRSAEILMRPQYLFDADFGHQDVNTYTLLDNVVRVPISGTELDLRVRHSWRDVSSYLGSASREYIYGGFNYNWNREWSTQAYVGTSGLYDVTTLYEGDKVRGGVLFQRDVWAYTPIALGSDLKYNRQGLFGGVSFGERFSLDGDLDFYQFSDGVDQTIFNIGPSYQLLFEPGVQELQLSYVFSGQSNDRQINPLIRFSPRSLNAHSVGFDYNRLLTDWWRVRGGYFHTWVNDGSNGGTWNLGSDFQLWRGAWLGVHYQRGSFGQGIILPNLQSVQDKNDNLNVNFGVSF